MHFPMSALIISTFYVDNSIDSINAAWKTMDDANMILSESTIDHSMSESVYRLKAFTVAYYKSINAESNDFVDLVPKKMT